MRDAAAHADALAVPLAQLAAAVAEPHRAAMLLALLDGRALTATELAALAGIAASTASAHLAQLTGSGLLAVVRQGRHRYFRISGEPAAELIERLLGHVTGLPRPALATGPAEPALRQARICYDHLAGEWGVRLLDGLRQAGHVDGHGHEVRLSATGQAWLGRLGIDGDALRRQRRPLGRECLDWSERRMHLAGALGSALLEHLLARGWARRQAQGRVLVLSAQATGFIEALAARP